MAWIVWDSRPKPPLLPLNTLESMSPRSQHTEKENDLCSSPWNQTAAEQTMLYWPHELGRAGQEQTEALQTIWRSQLREVRTYPHPPSGRGTTRIRERKRGLYSSDPRPRHLPGPERRWAAIFPSGTPTSLPDFNLCPQLFHFRALKTVVIIF